MPFSSVQHVYFDDLDALNILHNVRYLLMMERARGELFNELGFRWEDDLGKNPDKYHVVAEHQIRYLKAFRGEGDVHIDLTPTKLGTTSFTVAAKLTSKDGAIVHAESATRIVRLNPATDRPCPWTERFRRAVEPFLRAPGAGLTAPK
ncbi:MAG TPA: thioesterase family protein [Polyangiaceae bacterium]